LQSSNCWEWARKKEEGSSATDSLHGCNGCNGCQEEGRRRKKEEGRREKQLFLYP
jgi:hypothetical protein